MEKELKIQIPDGYEVDTEKSSFERIVFKQKTDKTKEMSDFLFDMLNESTCKITGEKEVTYYKNNEWVFQQDFKNERLWIRYGLIWKVFEEKYSLNYDQIRDFIASWIETNTGWRGLTPIRYSSIKHIGIETNTGWRGLTPLQKLNKYVEFEP